MNNFQINSVTEHKHLGLIISDDGTWHNHIYLITKKAFARADILRKFKHILDRKTSEKIYFTFVRPILEYADVVWDNATDILIKKLENVQIEAARIVTGGQGLYQLTDCTKRPDGKNSKTDARPTDFYTFMRCITI